MRPDRGMTLVEILIAAAVLGVVMATVFAVLSASSTTAEKMTITGELEHRGRTFVEACRNDFLDARFTDGTLTIAGTTYGFGIFQNGTEIRFRTMTGRTAAGDPEYGFTTNDGPQAGLACFLRFEPEAILRESSGALPATVSPASPWAAPLPALPATVTETLDVDMNRDGDRSDTFVHGKLVRYVVAPDGHPALAGSANPLDVSTVNDRVLLMVDPADGSRFDGNLDGEAAGAGEHPESVRDPLFRFVDEAWPQAASTLITNANVAADGRALVFTAFHGNHDHLRKGFVVRRNSERVSFRNGQ